MDLQSETIREHTQRLYRGARSMGFDISETEDLVQEVWLTYFNDTDSFKGQSRLSTFLYGILINKCRERWRSKSKISQTTDQEFEEIFASNFNQRGHWIKKPVSPEKFSEALSNLKAIDDCLEKIPTPQKAAFTLRDVEECEFPAICHELKVSKSNVHVLLFRARTALRECLTKEEV